VAQRLILPINECRVTAGYKNELYKKAWGFPHYGVDYHTGAATPTIWGLGDGEVAAAGFDSLFGGTVVVVYPAVLVHWDGVVRDLVARCFHMKSIAVKAGQRVTKDTRLGIMGNTGHYKFDPHLHIEFDNDILRPCHVPGLAKDGNIIKRGMDTTIDPSGVLHVKVSAPDSQQIVNRGYAGWNKEADWRLPVVR